MSDDRERFAGLGTGIVCDALGRFQIGGTMRNVRPVRSDATMAGRARTLLYGPRRGAAASKLNVITAIRETQPGEVLVIGTGNSDSWVFGGNLAQAALLQGLAALVTDACCRDGAALAQTELPCFSRGLATSSPSSIEPIGFDVPIVCGGVQVRPQDIVVGDCDGIVVVPSERTKQVADQIDDLNEFEEMYRNAVLDRAPLATLLDLLARKSRIV